MKLLSKPQVNIDASVQKKHQIDEGLMIARKVDAMRGSLLELQKQRAEFIQNTQLEIEKETSHLYQKKESLESEVKRLEEEKSEARKPLDKEWDLLKDEQFAFSQEKNIFAQKEVILSEKEFHIKNKEEELEEKLNKQELLLKEIDGNAYLSREQREEADTILKDAKNKREKIDEEINERKESIRLQEEKIAFDRLANEQVVKDIQLREQGLNERERQLKDREETLKRNIQRLR